MGFVLDQLRDVFSGPNILDRHCEKLVPRVPIVRERSIVYGQKRERLRVVSPHGLWVVLEKQTIFVLGLAKSCFCFYPLGYILSHTARIKAKAALRQSEDEYRLLF